MSHKIMENIPRLSSKTLDRLKQGFPVIGITGPRQSGKTTLARFYFSDKPYVSLEDPDQLDFAQSDPRRFLAQFTGGAIIDEVQRCPTLFSYLQNIVDTNQVMGQFILTGSYQFGFRQGITQSLAGRIGLIELLPFSLGEIAPTYANPSSLDELLYQGLYPPVLTRNIDPIDWYSNYVTTYLERDVQQIIQVKNLNSFRLFLRLCAGRSGQLLNLSAVGNEAGISHNTAKEWISVLEASYILYRLPPHFKNFSKRLVKSPKLYFYDTGVLSWLLGIRDQSQLSSHAMRGAIFENFVINELIKHQYINGQPSNVYYWRDNTGLEVDAIVDLGNRLLPIEIKSGATITSDYFRQISRWLNIAKNTTDQAFLVYGGDTNQSRDKVEVIAWRNLNKIFQQLNHKA